MEPVGGSSSSRAANVTVATATGAVSSVVGLLVAPTRPTIASVTSNLQTTGLCHNGVGRMPLQHPINVNNVMHHHQYPSTILTSSIPRPSPLVHPQSTSLLPSTPQLMLSTTSAAVPIQFQQHSGGSQQLVSATSATTSTTSITMPSTNITAVGMALSPFGILPHERVVQHHTHHRHQQRKLPASSHSPKTAVDTNHGPSGTQLLGATVNSQRFYGEPPQLNNKIKPYDSMQHQQHHKIRIVNGVTDKSLPMVPSTYVPQSYERYQPRNTTQQVGYLSVITRTAATTNSAVMNNTATNSNYYQTQAIPLQSKTSDNHDRQYYHFDSTVSASQPPQQQLDNILMMGAPVQRGDPMHIVKNLQSMQTDIDCYGVKKIVEQPSRLLATENSKTGGLTNLLNNGGKCTIEHHQQLPKSAIIDPLYNGQYFSRRQPPPAHLHQHHNQQHLQQHVAIGNTKVMPTSSSLAVVVTNGGTYLDVQQHRHHRWNLDNQKPPVASNSCFSGTISSSVFQPPSLQQQQYNNDVSTFNAQLPTVHQQQQILPSSHHNNFVAPSVNTTYYNNTTSSMVSPTVTSVSTTSSSVTLYNQHHHNNQHQHPNDFHDFANNLQGGSYTVNSESKLPLLPRVIVPDIEQELSHLCNDTTIPTSPTVKPVNITLQKPSFIDSYIKFIQGGADSTTGKAENECREKPKKLLAPLSSVTPKPISKPYVPLPIKKTLSASEQTPSGNGSSESSKKINNVITTADDDPRYFPLPKTSSIASISDNKSDNCDGSNGENSWASGDDDQDQWWKSSSASGKASVGKKKVKVMNQKKKNGGAVKKKKMNSSTPIKKQKTQHVQPRRQLSHRLAKEKSQKLLSSSISGNLDFDEDDVLSEPDSDVDPAWIPNSDENEMSKNFSAISSRRRFSHKKYSNNRHPPSTSSINNNNNNNNNNNHHLEDSTTVVPFKSGEFVALKSQFTKSGSIIPEQLWRVDGKSLLQKFQRCDKDNVYKSVSTYTGWSPSHYSMYYQVAVRLVTIVNNSENASNKPSAEVVVQICDSNNPSRQTDPNEDDDNSSTTFNETSKPKVDIYNSVPKSSSATVDNQCGSLRANFDVYIQTLASQALDSNFLGEIYRENDEYFLSNLRAVEVVTETWVQKINSKIIKDAVTDLSKMENIRTITIMYPNLNVCSKEVLSSNDVQLVCVMCGYQTSPKKPQQFVEICLSGVEYDFQTLEKIDNRKNSKTIPEKKMHCCINNHCMEKLVTFHKLLHLKYHVYEECCIRVNAEKNNSISNELTQDTTTVLNRLLADDEWIEKLFQMVRDTWSQANKLVLNNYSNCEFSHK